MKYLPIYSLLVMLCSACQSQQKKSALQQQDCWKLASNDKVLQVDEHTQMLYEPLGRIHFEQIPLIQAIDGQNYDVFIGITDLMRSEQLYEEQLKVPKQHIIGIRKNKGKSGRQYYDFFMRHEQQYVFRTIYDRENPETTVVVNIVSEDSARVRAYFNATAFMEKKLQCED